MANNVIEYIDIKTGETYSNLPEGKVIVTPEVQAKLTNAAKIALNNYASEYGQGSSNLPYNLEEVEIVETKPVEIKINPTDTEQNLKWRQRNKEIDEHINSEYSPEHQFNAYTFGGFNNLSPTQWVGRAIDFIQGDNMWDSWIKGNSGIVSDKFQAEHPIVSTALNAISDGILIGTPIVAKRMLPKIMDNYKLYKWLNSGQIQLESPVMKTTEEIRKMTGESKQFVKTSGVKRKTTRDTSRTTGSRDVTDPTNPGPIDFHNPRVTLETTKVNPEIYEVSNSLEYFPFMRGQYIDDVIDPNKEILMDLGIRPQIVKKWKLNETPIIDYIKVEGQPVIKGKNTMLSNKDQNWMWSDKVYKTWYMTHKNGGIIK